MAITRDRCLRRYDDNSFLYDCRVVGPRGFNATATGSCSVTDDHTIWLDLFHHTTDEAAAAIFADQHFRASSWNIQRNKKLVNVAYAYFTSLPQITTESDLQSIGMASDGVVRLIPTNGAEPVDVIDIKVYRERTENRRRVIDARIPAHAVAPQHIWRHDPQGQPTYYEVSKPAIFRVGLEPTTTLPFDGQAVDVCRAKIKRFEYVVLGFADTEKGLVAHTTRRKPRRSLRLRAAKIYSRSGENTQTPTSSQKNP